MSTKALLELEKSVKDEMMNVNRIEQALLPSKSLVQTAPIKCNRNYNSIQ